MTPSSAIRALILEKNVRDEHEQVHALQVRIRELLASRDSWRKLAEANLEKLGAISRLHHPAHTHCESCGFTWLDDGMNPIHCPYCKPARKPV